MHNGGSSGRKIAAGRQFFFFFTGIFRPISIAIRRIPCPRILMRPLPCLARFRGSQNRPHRGQRLYSFTASPVHLPKLCFHQLLNSRRNEPKINTRPFATLASREFFFFFNKIPPHNDCRNRHNFSNFFAIQI